MIHLTKIFMLAQAAVEGEPDGGGQLLNIPLEFVWGIGVVFLAVFFLITTLKRVRRSEQKSMRSVGERVDEYRPRLNPVRAQIDELMAELADLARQINGQIDTRIAKLDILQQEADRTIARLEALQGQAKGVAETEQSGGASFRHSGTHKESVNNSQATDEASALRDKFSSQPKNFIASDERTQAVLDMAQQGKSAVEIAQKLDRPVGEVELILALNKK